MQTPTQANRSLPTPTVIPLPSGTATITLTSLPTATSTPENTPTPRATSTPAAISLDNIDGLRRVVKYDLPLRGKLRDADWSQDGGTILARSELGIELLSGETLEPLHFFPGMALITELDGGKWLVRYNGQRTYLKINEQDYQLIGLEKAVDELGSDLIARKDGRAVRKSGEFELEIASLKTGDRRRFNYEDAGYYLDYMHPDIISPDGKWLVVWYTNWPDYHVLNLETLEVAYDLGRPYDTEFSPDSQYLLTLDNGGSKILQARNGIQVNRFSDGFIVRPTSQTYVYYRAVAWDWFPDSQRVGVVYCIEEQECELYLWSMATGQPDKIIKGLPFLTSGLDFSPQGDAFLTVSSDGYINSWSMEDGAALAESLPYDRDMPVLRQDGRLAALPRGSSIEILDVTSGEVVKEVGDYSRARTLMVDALTQEHLLVAGLDNLGPFSDLWDMERSELTRKFRPLDYPNTYADEPYCRLTSHGNRLVCGESPLQIFDVETGALLYSNKSQEGRLEWAISPDGNTLASCTMVYEPDTYEEIPTDRIFLLDISSSAGVISSVLEAKQGGICSAMVFSSEGTYLAARSGYIWKLGESQPLSTFTKAIDEPLLFNPDGNLLLSGKRLIQTDPGEILAELAVDSEVQFAAFDTGGYQLLLSTDQGIEIWKVSGDWQAGDQPAPGSVVKSWPAHPTPPIYDDFGGSALNPNLWELSTQTDGFILSQSEGVLSMQGEELDEGTGLDLNLVEPSRRSISRVATFEARLYIDKSSKGTGCAKIQIVADIPDKRWATQCRLGNNLTAGGASFVCDVISRWNGSLSVVQETDFIKTEFDRWYTVRIEIDPATTGVQYYLDGELVGSYISPQAPTLRHSRFIPGIGIYSVRSSTSIFARFDDIRITDR